MKTPFRRMLQGLGVLLLVPLLNACYEDQAATTSTAAMTGSVSNAPVAPAAPVAPPAPVVSNAPVLAAAVNTNAPGTNAVPDGEVLFKKQFDPSTLNLSPGVADIVKMAQSGVSPAIMLEFINQAPHAFPLTADEIVYLNDLGIPEDVIKAMLRKEGPAPVAQPAPPSASTNQAPQQTTTPAPAPAPPPQAQPQPAPDQSQAAQTSAGTTVVQQPVYVTQPQTVVTYQYFYDSLAPYGTWYYVSGYGYCWRPTVAVVHVDWRPYCHGGRWVYTTYGWYWQSDYTWGWAPFHYGRWHLHASYGWLWVPDTVWGPSWVTWRYADGYCGWAPLPPGAHYTVGVGFTYHGSRVSVGFGFGLGHAHYTFVSARHFTSPHVHQYAASVQQAQTIYNNTTIINNYIHGDNNTIINRGIAREEIVRHTRADIPTLAVRDLPANERANLRPDRVAREGNQAVVYRQTLPSVSPAVDKGSAPQVKAPAPAVAVLSREQRAANVANLAGGSSQPVAPTDISNGKTRTGIAPSVPTPPAAGSPNAGLDSRSPNVRPPGGTDASGQVLVSPRGRGARGGTTTGVTPEPSGTPSGGGERTRPNAGDRGTPSGNTYTPPRRDLSPAAPTAPLAPSAPAAADPAKPSVPSYTPPSPSYTPPMRRETPGTPATPSTPSYTPPTRRETAPAPSTPSSPSYTPPARRETAPAPATPSYTPPARREVAPNPTTLSPPSYTPPARRETTPAPSTPSYTPPARREAPAPPSSSSYVPPSRNDNRSAVASSVPAAPPSPSYTPPAPVAPPAPSRPAVTPSAPPTPSYTPPARPETRRPAPINPPAYERPANPPPTPAYNPPARPSLPAPSPSYTPPVRSLTPSAPPPPSYTPPAAAPSRGGTPAYTPPSSGGGGGGEPSRRNR
ncbi:hypothetical protein NXS98_03870 [Fontisphaera persica]|uniref:DUF6600 domain-containing protein n=1 Tax=Fontisphaera persica TaxID=2974023 RepID=UPI0024C05B6D|nr:DUF6600 domain-containing protein [Fontisphaera persica]WCJ60277.1 hypothetical protein NXS98_03870 [Fontisphaera persica]